MGASGGEGRSEALIRGADRASGNPRFLAYRWIHWGGHRPDRRCCPYAAPPGAGPQTQSRRHRPAHGRARECRTATQRRPRWSPDQWSASHNGCQPAGAAPAPARHRVTGRRVCAGSHTLECAGWRFTAAPTAAALESSCPIDPDPFETSTRRSPARGSSPLIRSPRPSCYRTTPR